MNFYEENEFFLSFFLSFFLFLSLSLSLSLSLYIAQSCISPKTEVQKEESKIDTGSSRQSLGD